MDDGKYCGSGVSHSRRRFAISTICFSIAIALFPGRVFANCPIAIENANGAILNGFDEFSDKVGSIIKEFSPLITGRAIGIAGAILLGIIYPEAALVMGGVAATYGLVLGAKYAYEHIKEYIDEMGMLELKNILGEID